MAHNGKTLDSSEVVMHAAENVNQIERSNFKIICNVDENAKLQEAATKKEWSNFPKISKIKINKPLIPLKIAIFCWFAGCASLAPFIGLYLKQLGLTLSQLSVIYIITPFIQLFAPSLSGIVADKLGRSKPVLQANLLITLAAANSMLFMPRVENSCALQLISCGVQTYNNASMMELCNIHKNDSHIISCVFNCSTKESQGLISDICFQNYISSCNISFPEEILENLTLSGYTLDNETAAMCTKENLLNNNHVYSTFCNRHLVGDCSSICTQNANTTHEEVKCQNNLGKTHLFILSTIFLVVFHTFLSNVYRVFDVTAMSMVKTYNSNFGRQRVWAITGAMILSLLSGYLISLVTPEGGLPRYDVPFYVFDTMAVTTIFAVWKLEVKIDPPAKDMLRKTRILVKDIDILVFMIMIFVIGTAWSFTRLFSTWYLEDLGAPSTLMGLAVAVGSLSGLPFLFTSNWFVKKLGSSNLLLFSLIGYFIWCIGYSFLINPWYALIYQILEIPTYHLLWVTAVTYSHAIAPPGLRATVVATAGGIHYGIAKGSGSLIGGFIMSKYGGRMAYRVMAAICAGTAVLYALYICYRKKCKKSEKDIKDTDFGEWQPK